MEDRGSAFVPPWWLANPHLQTAWGRLTRPRRLVTLRREILETPDGDDLVLDHVDSKAGAPRVLFLHGLEGSSYSVYLQGLLQKIAALGWNGTAMNFRSCARDPRHLSRMLPNRRPRLYHSGETGDFAHLVRTTVEREPATPLFAVGASLGGNVLLKWLGENPEQRAIAAAATLSVPYDLGAAARHLERGLGRLYVAMFLVTLRRKYLDLAARFPQAAERTSISRVLGARTFTEFDEAATAPLHGFAGAEDYYARSSSIGFLGRIATPVLCVSAADDPFLDAAVVERAREAASPRVTVRITARGGHAGFVAGAWPWSLSYWGEEAVVRWLSVAGGLTS